MYELYKYVWYVLYHRLITQQAKRDAMLYTSVIRVTSDHGGVSQTAAVMCNTAKVTEDVPETP